jgi:hypothetical protein
MENMATKTATRWRKGARDRAFQAARWQQAYADAKPSAQLVCRMFGTSPLSLRKANAEIQNGNGHTRPSLDEITRWWHAASDAERAAFVHDAGVGAVWNAIVPNLK